MENFDTTQLLLPNDTNVSSKKSTIQLKLDSPRSCNIITNWEIKHNTDNNKYYVYGDISDGCCTMMKEVSSTYLDKVDGDYLLTTDGTHIVLAVPSKNNQDYRNLEDIQILLSGK